ncbi:septum formation family protein [Nocardiopsis ansamitocini]|uniref:Septum formation-related domain-containing protein n=1 Tax=Nocardiopsis ansamitocini TaxID=1670832 RepID=A0A9W6P6I0_9ACTN|nr:septum formation family protein [Nocardiopsis ansamitocini]GLU47946.1 hypothetical protein Nans01_22970 [Nocardiopsis ansamitocini]
MTNGTFRTRVRRITGTAALAAGALALSGCGVLNGLIGGDVFELSVGDCIPEETGEGEVSSVETVECSEPHSSEVYASFMVPDGDYPGEDAILEQADTDCREEFETFVGTNYDESELDLTYLYPVEQSWDQLDDREILCFVVDPAGDTTGTLKGSNR